MINKYKTKRIRRGVICVDFDGVIYSNLKYQGTTILNGLPVNGVIESLKELSKKNRVIINSSRFEVDEGMEAVRQWMIRHGMNYELSKHKPTADIYIDDRAICFSGVWSETLKEIKTFKQWQSDAKLRSKIIRKAL